jgi:acetylglutamate kinase
MKYVVKLGGAGLETPALLEGCTRAIAELVRDGNQVAVVHGGGVQLTRTLKALGKQSEFIDGLRVTDAETRDVALMVLAGKREQRPGCRAGRAGPAGVGLSRRRWIAVPRAQEAHRCPISALWARLRPATCAGLRPSGS